MPIPRFTKTANSQSPFDFDRGRFLPVNEPRVPNIIIGKAGGGQIKAAFLGTTERFWKIVINRVSKTNRDNLIAFFEDNTVNWSLKTFTFRDESSNTFTVRLWNTSGIDFPQVHGGNLYNISITVREEIT